jgi:hypothetical protein
VEKKPPLKMTIPTTTPDSDAAFGIIAIIIVVAIFAIASNY